MNMVSKADFFVNNEDFLFHLDDDYEEISCIMTDCKNVKPIWVYSSSWRKDCDKLIFKNKDI